MKFNAYLADTYQRIRVSQVVSDKLPITIGGSTLFLAFINDLCIKLANK